MPLPASLTLIPVHVKVLHTDTDGTPATGRVIFAMPYTLRDASGGVVLGRSRFYAKLVNGEATINLPATDDPDISPSGWTYTVTPDTSAWRDPPFELEVPVATVGTFELAAHGPAVTPTVVATYALLGHTHTLDALSDVDVAAATNGQVLGRVAGAWTGVANGGAVDATTSSKGIVQLAGDLAGTAAAPTVPGLASKADAAAVTTALAGKQPIDADLTAIAALAPADDALLQRKAGAWTSRTPAQVKSDLVLVKADVGLGNADNTSDVNKPVSTAQAAAILASASPNPARRWGCIAITFTPHDLSDVDPKTIAIAASRLHAYWLPCPTGQVISGVRYPLQAIGSGSGQVVFSVYQDDMSRLGTTGNVAAAVTAGSGTEWRSHALTASGAVTGAGVWVVTHHTLDGAGPNLLFADTDHAAWMYNPADRRSSLRIDGASAPGSTLDLTGAVDYIDFLIGVA